MYWWGTLSTRHVHSAAGPEASLLHARPSASAGSLEESCVHTCESLSLSDDSGRLPVLALRQIPVRVCQ